MSHPNHPSSQEDSQPIHVWGYVNSDGEKESGSGFSVIQETKKGTYFVTYSNAFSSRPAVVATATAGEDSTRIANTNDVSTTGFRLRIKNNSNDLKDSAFSFIAVGT